MVNPRHTTNVVIASIALLFAFMLGVYADSTTAIIPIIYIRVWLESGLHLSQEAAIFFTFLSPLLYSILFCLWNINLFYHQARLATRAKMAYALTTLSCLAWYIAYGLHPARSVDTSEAKLLLITNIAFFLLLALILFLNRKESSFWRVLMFNLLLFSWIIISAFPWYFPTF